MKPQLPMWWLWHERADILNQASTALLWTVAIEALLIIMVVILFGDLFKKQISDTEEKIILWLLSGRKKRQKLTRRLEWTKTSKA